MTSDQNGTVAHARKASASATLMPSVAVEQHGAYREELIPILTEVNRTVGYLPAEALE